MKYLNALAIGALFALAAAGCSYTVTTTAGGPRSTILSAELKETEAIPARHINVGAEPRIVVENRVGRVTLTAGDDGAVEVSAEKRAATKEDLAAIRLDVETKDNVITIRWGTPDQTIVNRALDITIEAPKSASLTVENDNGPVTVEGFARGADARTGVGPITVTRVAGDLKLDTGNGPIQVEGATGTVSAESGVGPVTIKGAKGARKVHTGNGAITLDGADGAVAAETGVGRIEVDHVHGNLKLNTGNGAIAVRDAEGTIVAETGVGSVEFAGRLSGKSRIHSGNGTITVTLPADSRLHVEAATGNGAIQNAFGLAVEGVVSVESKGTLGDGSGGSLRMETGVGSIHLKKK